MPDGDLATVTYIVDGDTIDVDIGGTTYRVRFIGMDTPERGDYFFSEATEANLVPVEGQQLILVEDVSETDRYGRLRFIEVKERWAGADRVTITKNEILTGTKSSDHYILALVEVDDGQARLPRYVRLPFQKEPDFGVTNINFNLAEFIAMSESSG